MQYIADSPVLCSLSVDPLSSGKGMEGDRFGDRFSRQGKVQCFIAVIPTSILFINVFFIHEVLFLDLLN